MEHLTNSHNLLSCYDSITGSYSYSEFIKRVKAETENKKEISEYIIYMDLAHFHYYNEKHGRKYGDNILSSIGQTLREILPPYNIFCRKEKDIFIIYLCEYRPLEPILKELTQQCKDRLEIHPYFGVQKFQPAQSVIYNIERAELACKTIKRNHLKNLAFYTPSLSLKRMEEDEIEIEMEQALINGEFKLYLQPQISMKNKSLIGCEALTRWVHPNKGIISPDNFIPIFEKNYFIVKLDQYIWEQAFLFYRTWLDKQNKPIMLSLNVSRAFPLGDYLINTLTNLAEKYKIQKQYLQVEFTESSYLENIELLYDTMYALKELGISIAVDDFGTGYSSLNMLMNCPADTIKFDKSFLQFQENNAQGHIFYRKMTELIQTMNKNIIAEGIETIAMHNFIQSCNITIAQGYLYSPPLNVSSFFKKFNNTI